VTQPQPKVDTYMANRWAFMGRDIVRVGDFLMANAGPSYPIAVQLINLGFGSASNALLPQRGHIE